MGFNCGIVGLPNVGKSTLFNALTATQAAQAANYPFCTIEPNVGRVAVPDPRLDKLAAIANSAKIVATQLEFVDIAGLVKGASKGEGLGNQFLGNIREVDAIAHVLRCFEDGDVTHVSGSVDPVRDAEIVETELMLADLDSLEKRLPNLEKRAKGGDKEAAAEAPVVKKALDALREGKPAREAAITAEERPVFPPAADHRQADDVRAERRGGLGRHRQRAQRQGRGLGQGARHAGGRDLGRHRGRGGAAAGRGPGRVSRPLGLKETGLARVVRAGYELLDLVTFFTVGPKEARAWTVRREATAPEAAGVIHTDFEKGFIRAETIAYDDYVALNGEAGARDAGKLRLEGKEYAVKDGDVFHFRFNV